jgi:hypothetical protein
MKAAGLDVLLLTKPANMFYLTGDGRLRAHAMITQDVGLPHGVLGLRRHLPFRVGFPRPAYLARTIRRVRAARGGHL